MDCTTDEGKNLCQKFGVEGYPTIKYFSRETGEMGEKYEEAREYNKLKKFVTQKSKDPCDPATLANCNKKEKAFIEEVSAWDEAKMKSELDTINADIDAAKANQTELSELFEKQKDVAMATMAKQQEAKTTLDKVAKASRYKMLILEQKAKKKDGEL